MKVIPCEWVGDEDNIRWLLMCRKNVLAMITRTYENTWITQGERHATRELAMAAVEKHHGVRRLEE